MEIFAKGKEVCHPSRTLKYERSLSSSPSCCCCFCYETFLATTYDLFEMAREILFMFLWHLAPVVADVTLGDRIPPISGSGVFSEAAACWETLHRPESRTWDESVHMCHSGGQRQCARSEWFSAIQPPTCPPQDTSSLQNQNNTSHRYSPATTRTAKKSTEQHCR